MFTRFDSNKSTKGASKLRRDLINAEIANLRDLLPLPPSTRQRLSQLQLMALVCVYVRKANYFQQIFKRYDINQHSTPTANFGFSKALNGFLMMMTQNGKLLYISDNAAEYLGHSMEDLLIHGDSVYDIIDKQDQQSVRTELARTPADAEERVFLCRMNVARNARRQMRFGDQKVVLVRGHFVSYLPLCSRNEPVFLAACTPLAMPETRECVVHGATNVFTTIHTMDMKILHIDNNSEWHLGWDRAALHGASWYHLLHPDCCKEAQTKHRLIIQSESERSCIVLVRVQRRSGHFLWVHSVLQLEDSADSSQQPVTVSCLFAVTQSESERSCIVLVRVQRRSGHFLWVHSVLQVEDSADSSQQPVTVSCLFAVTQSESERSCIVLVRVQRRSGHFLWVHSVLQVEDSADSSQQPVTVSCLFAVTQSESERSCIVLVRVQRRSGHFLWVHSVLQVKDSVDSSQQPVIVCTNQVLSEQEAVVMKANPWLYHYYAVQSKLHYGLAYEAATRMYGPPPPDHLQVYPPAVQYQPAPCLNGGQPPNPGLQAPLPHVAGHVAAVHYAYERPDTGPVDYSVNMADDRYHNLRAEDTRIPIQPNAKRKHKISEVKSSSSLVSNISPRCTPAVSAGGGDTLVALASSSIISRRPAAKNINISEHTELIDQWNPSPPWSESALQKVPDVCHQELSPYVTTTPPTPSGTPSAYTHTYNHTFVFDWSPEQYVPHNSLQPGPLLSEEYRHPNDPTWIREQRISTVQLQEQVEEGGVNRLGVQERGEVYQGVVGETGVTLRSRDPATQPNSPETKKKAV